MVKQKSLMHPKENFEDAGSIGRTLCAKFVITGKFGGRL